jgi:hypothetical protein
MVLLPQDKTAIDLAGGGTEPITQRFLRNRKVAAKQIDGRIRGKICWPRLKCLLEVCMQTLYLSNCVCG